MKKIDWLSSQEEKFIFSNERGNPIRGNDAIRKAAMDAGLEAKKINSVNFRKMMATSLQVS